MSATTSVALKSCPLYIDGKPVISAGPKDVQYNPATGEAVAEVPQSTPEEVAAAVASAHKAFPAWSKTPVIQRCKVLFKYRELLEAHVDEFVALITEENGKTIDEARGSFDRGLECVEFACGAPTLMMGETVDRVGTSVDGRPRSGSSVTSPASTMARERSRTATRSSGASGACAWASGGFPAVEVAGHSV